MDRHVEPGDWVEGPFWEAPVQVVTVQELPSHDWVSVNGPHRDQSRAYVLTPDDWDQIQRVARADYRNTGFTGAPTRFRLAINAHRLRLSHSIDPYAALNASRIDPLPHQFEAVYEHLLARPVVRALLAHDAGAGKTIMAGLVTKELGRRQDARRVLIVAPAGLTIQWRRELLTRFGEDFVSWDIESDDEEGRVVRYIEVKGRGPAGADVVGLTELEWEAARCLEDQHWLYIVRLGDRMMWMIQNPHTKLKPRELKRWVVNVGDTVSQGETVRLEEESV